MLGEIDHAHLAWAVLERAVKDVFLAKGKDKEEAIAWLTGKRHKRWLYFWCDRCSMCPETIIHRIEMILRSPELTKQVKELLKNNNLILLHIDN